MAAGEQLYPVDLLLTLVLLTCRPSAVFCVSGCFIRHCSRPMDEVARQNTITRYTFVVEHLDPELGPWSELEYKAIDVETRQAGSHFILSSVPAELLSSGRLHGIVTDTRNDAIEKYFADRTERICLLDPAAAQELTPEDGRRFDIFLFGGILGEEC